MDFPESIKLYDKSIYRQFVELVDTLDVEDTDLIGHVIESETSEARLILDGEITFDRESPDPSVGFRGRYVPCFTRLSATLQAYDEEKHTYITLMKYY